MLGTAGAVMPGGVLPPESEEDTKSELVSTGSNDHTEKTTDATAVTTTQKPSDNPRTKESPKTFCKEGNTCHCFSGKHLRKTCKTFFNRMKLLLTDYGL